MNQVLVVGIVEKNPEIINLENLKGNKLIKFRLKTDRPFRNKDGEVIQDYINIKVWQNCIDDVDSILETDNIIGVRGRINSFKSPKDDFYYNEVIAERLFFIS